MLGSLGNPALLFFLDKQPSRKKSEKVTGAGDQQERLSADWIVGFVDGEGCFHVAINRCPKMRTGYQVLPEFRVVQHEQNWEVLERIKEFFGFGKVGMNRKDEHGTRKEFRVRGIKNLQKLVEFFCQHPLKTSGKKESFRIFKEILDRMGHGEHLTRMGLSRIRKLALSMNRRRRPRWGVQNPQRPYAGHGCPHP
ncbi:MAG: LAGLIDADG family homing endonuclease [Candidatus Hadarchaeales archaeon]